MKIAIIDNEDSFTYNLFQVFLRIHNCEVVVLPYKDFAINQLKFIDGIVISPGPGVPAERPKLKELIEFFQLQKPILGICLGHQFIATYYGAKLVQLPHVFHGLKKEINITSSKSALFAGLPQKFNVGLYHSWIISNDNLPENIEITAKTQDGLIMGIKHKIHPIEGVQFHPESYISQYGYEMLKNWTSSIGKSSL